jgi:hypothetical protein
MITANKGLALAKKFIASHEFNVWGLVFLAWFGLYQLFKVVFGSADGSSSLSENELRKLAEEKDDKTSSKGSSRKERSAPETIDYTARNTVAASTATVSRAQAVEWMKEALPKTSSPARKEKAMPSSEPVASPAPVKPPKRAPSQPATPRAAAKFAEGAMVSVSSRSEPGSKPRPGGAGHVIAVNAVDGAWVYEVSYVLGGKETGLAQNLLSAADHLESSASKRKRQPTEKAAAAADVEEAAPAKPVKRARKPSTR